ncbi:hypothetical protein V2J09_010794 [Rumex salicifolius]
MACRVLFYLECSKGLQHREIIPKKAVWRASERLELINADLYDPISPISNAQKRYNIVLQFDSGIFISQQKYVLEMLKKFGMEGSNSVSNFMVLGCKIHKDVDGAKMNNTLYIQFVGSLMYVTATRPDVEYVVCLISRYMASPTEVHQMIAKRTLRYLQDSDYVGSVEDSKSTYGCSFILSNGVVAWSNCDLFPTTLSTTEAEIVAAAVCACQVLWMKRVFTIKLSRNPVMHGKSKHIYIRFYFLHNLVKFCGTHQQVADILTKRLKLESVTYPCKLVLV